MRVRRPATIALLTVGMLLLLAAPALADPAKPSNYISTVEASPSDGFAVSIQGGDSYFVLEVQPGTEVIVPGYDDDEDLTDWQELEVYLRVLADGTVQLNRSSEAYYLNGSRYFGELPDQPLGVGVAPDWETVASDGRVAWHDHRIHFMGTDPGDRVDPTISGPQPFSEYGVELVVDGEPLVIAGQLEYIADGSPIPVIGLALLGLVGGVLLARRDVKLAALLALVTGGTAAGLLIAAGVGRAAGFDLATPPVALVGVGAVAPLLGATVGSLADGQRKALVVLGGAALTVFGLLSTGALDQLVGGAGGGFGSWWLRPTLPADVAPGVLRLAMAAATGLGVALVATQLITPLDEGLDDLGVEAGSAAPTPPSG